MQRSAEDFMVLRGTDARKWDSSM